MVAQHDKGGFQGGVWGAHTPLAPLPPLHSAGVGAFAFATLEMVVSTTTFFCVSVAGEDVDDDHMVDVLCVCPWRRVPRREAHGLRM